MIHVGDCLEVMKTLDAGSIDAIVTDPPYGLSFMGKDWDHGVPGEAFWSEALRVAKPGTHLLAFGGTRTFHRLTVAIEDAGWEIRDCIMWVYGSGFPKSHDVSKAIDREAGAEREVVGPKSDPRYQSKSTKGWREYRKGNTGESNSAAGSLGCYLPGQIVETAPATEAAQQWQGWGTALKPAWEPVIVARKPLVGTVAQNVQEYGTGAVNVDGCRIGTEKWICKGGNISTPFGSETTWNTSKTPDIDRTATGRWPANLIHDGSDEVVGLFPSNAGGSAPASGPSLRGENVSVARGKYNGLQDERSPAFHGDSGSAARFFYCAKASKADRDSGLDGWEAIHRVNGNKWTDQDYRVTRGERPQNAESGPRRNHHPTVKPNDLMRYLCRLTTPPGGTVLDPFCGSGSTGKAAVMEGFEFIGIELNPEYAAIANARIQAELDKTALLETAR